MNQGTIGIAAHKHLRAALHSSQSGVVMVLAALLMSVLIGLFALAIDSARLASAHSQKLYSADYAALGALQGYLRQAPGTPHAARHAAAISRAERIAGLNKLTSAYGARQAEANEIRDEISGKLDSGRWWQREPDTCVLSGCPCNLPALNATDPARGCFQPCENDGCERPDGDLSKAKLLANSIELRLNTKAGSGIRNIFAGLVLGQRQTAIAARATAAAKPRNGVILVDISAKSLLDGAAPPQPLTNIVTAASALVNEFETRGAEEDQIALVAFDQSNPVPFETPLLGKTQLTALKNELAKPLNAASEFYPLAGSQADLPRAIDRAHAILTQNRFFNQSYNYIMAITSGLTTCQKKFPAGVLTCADIQIGNHLSLEETLHDKVENLLAPDAIIFHVLPAGLEIKPHTAVVKWPGRPECMTVKEMRRRNYSAVIARDDLTANQTKYLSLPAAGPADYYLPNLYLYSAAATSRGVWVPLREPCAVCHNPDDLCAGQSDPPDRLTDANDTYLHVVPSVFPMDAASRLTCDLRCRTIAQQVTEAADELYLSDTILLVK